MVRSDLEEPIGDYERGKEHREDDDVWDDPEKTKISCAVVDQIVVKDSELGGDQEEAQDTDEHVVESLEVSTEKFNLDSSHVEVCLNRQQRRQYYIRRFKSGLS